MVESKEHLISAFGETDVGISLYLSNIDKHGGEPVAIKCTFKHRYSDFIVNEIDENGDVVWFKPETDLQRWKKVNIEQTLPSAPEIALEEVKEPEETKGDGFTLYPEVLIKLESEILQPADFNKLQDFIAKLKSGDVAKDSFLIFDEDFGQQTKERRASIHQFFRESVKLYETDTVVEGDKRLIRAFLSSGFSNRTRKRMNLGDRKVRDKTMPEYLQVVLFKTNVESMQAIHYISKRLRKVPRQFQVAGNKDKRGITTQRVTIHRMDAEQLIRQQRCKDWDPKIKVGTFERVFKPL